MSSKDPVPLTPEELPLTPKELADLRLLMGVNVTPPEEMDKASGLTLAEKASLMAQGALFNTTDEAKAALRSVLGGVPYDEALAEERAKLEAARDKPGSFKYELGGAIVPGLLAAPFTAGASVPMTMGRLAFFGGSQALGAAVGDREGSLGERLTEDPAMLALQTSVGAVAGPAVGKAINLGGRVVKVVAERADAIKKAIMAQLSRPVQNEVRRIAASSGVSPEEIVARIKNGEIFADMSEQAAEDVSGINITASEGGATIKEAVRRRADELPEAARDQLRRDLTEGASMDDNVTLAFEKTTEELLDLESAAYNKIFAEQADRVYPELGRAILKIAGKSKNIPEMINDFLDDAGRAPIFRLDPKTKAYELTREFTLEEGEFAKQAFMDAADQASGNRRGSKKNLMKGYEASVKEVLDSISEPLKTTRANWARIRGTNNAFEAGKKILRDSSEDAQKAWEAIERQGPEAIGAFRLGVATFLKSNSERTTSLANKQIRDFDNEKMRDWKILQMIYPGDDIDDVMRQINLAAGALTTKTRVTEKSPTAARLGAAQRQGGQMVGAALDVATGGMVSSVLRLVRSVLTGASPEKKLSQETLDQVAKILVTEDADLMRRALADPDVMGVLETRIINIANRIELGGAGSAAYGASQAAGENEIIKKLASTVSPDAAKKLIEATGGNPQ
jgi:hypothetical protein